MTAVISSNVAEKALCWCEGRKRRIRRAKPRTGRISGESAEFAIKGRFYTQTFRSPDTPDGSRVTNGSGARPDVPILPSTFRKDSDLEYSGPKLAGDKETFSAWIVCDAV